MALERKFEKVADLQLVECQNYSPLILTLKTANSEISGKFKNILESHLEVGIKKMQSSRNIRGGYVPKTPTDIKNLQIFAAPQNFFFFIYG